MVLSLGAIPPRPSSLAKDRHPPRRSFVASGAGPGIMAASSQDGPGRARTGSTSGLIIRVSLRYVRVEAVRPLPPGPAASLALTPPLGPNPMWRMSLRQGHPQQ